MSMQLTLVVPGVLAQPAQALAAAPSLAMLAQLAGAPRVEARGIAAAIVAALGASPDMPVAPLMALGAGVDPDYDYMMAADPVFLAADRDDLVLIQRVDDLSSEETTTLVTMLNRHFETDDLRFMPPRPDAWFVRCSGAPDLVTSPFDAAHRRGLYPHLPRGADAGIWKRWQNEIGMLLHEHAINTAREARGAVPVNAVWFWGGGRLADALPLPRIAAVAATGRTADLVRGIALSAAGSIRPLEPGDTARSVIERASAGATVDKPHPGAVTAVIEPGKDHDMTTLESRWFAPALAALSRHRIDTLHLITDGNGAAARWTAQRPTLWRRIATGVRRAPLDVPAPPAS
jgi:hypothetical protein